VIADLSYGPYGERNLFDLYLPECSEGPFPTVICIHGGGWKGGSKEGYRWMAQDLAGHGLAAASITYRFWPEWRCPAAIDDAQRVVRWLRHHASRYGLDPARFGAIGGSAGGHLASYLGLMETRDNSDAELAPYSSKVQCVVDCYGPVDFVGMMTSASAPIVEGFMGKPLAGAEEDYRRASPYHLVSPNPPPFLLVHGTADIGVKQGQVPIDQSERFAAKLRQAGGDVTFLPLEGGPHGFTANPQGEYAQRMWRAALPFVTKHLARHT
jgi:acetyl esterase/lipase